MKGSAQRHRGDHSASHDPVESELSSDDSSDFSSSSSSDDDEDDERDEEGDRFRAAQAYLPDVVRREGRCSLLGLQRPTNKAWTSTSLRVMSRWDAQTHARQLQMPNAASNFPLWVDQPELDIPTEACLHDDAFTAWLERVYALEKALLSSGVDATKAMLNAFDQDRAVWARLHRLVALNEVLLLTLDCRWPHLHAPVNLVRLIRRWRANVPIVFVLTKVDLVAETTVASWERALRHHFRDDSAIDVIAQSCYTPATSHRSILPNDDASLTALKARTKRPAFRRRFPFRLRDLIAKLATLTKQDDASENQKRAEMLAKTLTKLPSLPTAFHANGRPVEDVQWENRGQRQRSHRRRLRKMEVEHFGRAGIEGGVPISEKENEETRFVEEDFVKKIKVAILGATTSGARTLHDHLHAYAAPLFDLPTPLSVTAPMLLPVPLQIVSGQLRPPNQVSFFDALHVLMQYLPVPTLLGLDATRFMTKSEAKLKKWTPQEVIEVFGREREYVMPSPEDPSVFVVDHVQTLRILYGYFTSGRFLISFKPPSQFDASLQHSEEQGALQASEAAAAEAREQKAFEAYQSAIKANAADNWETEWKKERKWKHNKGRRQR